MDFKSIEGVSVLILLLIFSRITWNLYFHPLAKYPGPKLFAASNVVSSAYAVRGKRTYKVAELHNKYGPVVRVAPNELSYVTPQAWKDIYSSSRSLGMPQLQKYVPKNPPEFEKNTLVSQDDDAQHARLRKPLAPGFSTIEIRNREGTISKHTNDFLRLLRRKESKGEEMDILYWFECLTADVICELTYGEPFHALENETRPEAIHNANSLLRIFHISIAFMRVWPILYIYMLFQIFNILKLQDSLKNLVDDNLAARTDRLAKNDGAERQKDFVDFLSRDIGAENSLKSKEIGGVTSDLMIAGADTVANALSGLLYLLLKNPSKLQLLNEEIRTTFNSESQITLTSTTNLKYQNAVISESMRLFPSGPETIRRKVGAGGSMICGQHVPENTLVGVYHWAAGHNEASWHETESFIPERWLGDERFVDDVPGVISPFQAGPRNCIGQNLALGQIRFVMAKLLWNFNFELCRQSEDWINMPAWTVSYEKPPLMVKLKSVVR